MSKVVDYLNAVDSDARMAAGFENNPEESMLKFGLLPQEICALISGGGNATIAQNFEAKAELGTLQIIQHLYKTFDDKALGDYEK
ncbi:MAG: hypothetical protein MJK04_34595 [Psychrosphaera sp.]|nr:hypothetical protein [Psychrosphaera sp.]